MKKIKNSRAASFAAVTTVYILAAVLGVVLYRAFSHLGWWQALLVADVGATVLTFIFSLIFGNASVYDPYWSVQPPVILVAFAFGRRLTALGVLLLVAVGFWAVRLTANWAYTFGGLNRQDWRYTMLNEKTGRAYPLINFLGIHLVPTLVVYFCTLPAVYAIITGARLTVLSAVFVGLSVLAASIQCVADIEMHRYRKNRTSPFIRVGLWKHSRHPNYLGEILMWWGIAIAVLASVPSAIHLTLGAVLNTLLFLFVSIPMADARQSRKDGFAEYKRETRMLLPIPKRAPRVK